MEEILMNMLSSERQTLTHRKKKIQMSSAGQIKGKIITREAYATEYKI